MRSWRTNLDGDRDTEGRETEVSVDHAQKRWTDLRPDGKPRRKVGDLFWVDKDESLRIVVKCAGCGKGLLARWETSTAKEVRCPECAANHHVK
jgi:DNA-directed RNA polymerase subunit RPC12/RpoP